jgi:hypothetical protein
LSIQLNRLKKVSSSVDTVVNALGETAAKLEKQMIARLAEGNAGGRTVDLALARADIQRMMVESGYYDVTGSLLDTTYQSFIDGAHSAYKAQYGKSLQYSDTSLERLQQIRDLDQQTFNSIAEDNINQLQKVMVDYQYGATDLKGATDRLAQIMGPDFERYAETVVRSTAHAFDREASNMMATDAGFDLFEYVGPDDSVTSEICQELLAKGPQKWDVWQATTNDGGYPVTVYGGHPNCRHSVVPVLSKED